VLTASLNYYRNFFQAGFLQPSEVLRYTTVLEIPTLMIWGEDDIPLGKELTYGSDRYVPNLQLHYIPRCSHWVQQEQPETVNRLMREFL
jgi:epoxide hydrolase 4